jgi:phosphoglycolate phosphatase-like HAD superfamily hydrolase
MAEGPRICAGRSAGPAQTPGNRRSTCAAHRLRVAPEELAVIGDDPELEMAMAHRGHALAIAVTTGIHAADHFTALPPEQSPHLTIDGVGKLPDLLMRGSGDQACSRPPAPDAGAGLDAAPSTPA